MRTQWFANRHGDYVIKRETPDTMADWGSPTCGCCERTNRRLAREVLDDLTPVIIVIGALVLGIIGGLVMMVITT